MNPCEFTAAITAIANLLAAHMSDEELSLLAAVLTQLADTLSVIAVGRSMGKGSGEVPCKKISGTESPTGKNRGTGQ